MSSDIIAIATKIEQVKDETISIEEYLTRIEKNINKILEAVKNVPERPWQNFDKNDRSKVGDK